MKIRLLFSLLLFAALPAWGGFSFIFISSNLIVSYNTSTGTQPHTAVTSPSIRRQPVSQIAQPGDLALFNITAAGTPPLKYEWRKNGQKVINGGRISGAGTTTLRIRKINRHDAGLYRVIVSNAAGSASSGNARLTVTRLTVTRP